jgi:hypothetical protein
MDRDPVTTKWLAAQQHSGANSGDSETHVVFVELKEPSGERSGTEAAPLGPSEA